MATATDPQTVLEVRDLHVRFRTLDGIVEAVKGIGLTVAAGETVAIVGESGSGKSQTMMAAMRLLASNGEARGVVDYRGHNLLKLPKAALNRVRGRRITMIFQEPMTSLDPLYTVGNQLIEPIRRHRGLGAAAARTEALRLLELVKIPEPERRMGSYPYELSGGQRQRVMIAMALANDPDILIADEPTTALDVTIQAQILSLLAELQKKFGMAIVFITHDLGIVRRFANRVYVMRRGEVVEHGPTEQVFTAPSHPYTKMLLAAEPTGRKAPPEPDAPVLLQGHNVEVVFRLGGGFLGGAPMLLKAVDRISLSLREGQTIGVVGEFWLRQVDARACVAAPLAERGGHPLRGARHLPYRSPRHAPAASRAAARLPGPVRLAFAAHDGRPDRHRGAARARAVAVGPRARPPRQRRAGGGRPRPGDAQPLSARILGRPAPAHRHRPCHNPQAEGGGA